MLSMLRGPLTAGLIAIFMLSCTAGASGAAKIVRGTAATGEVATVAPSIGEQAFMRDRYWRMRTFAPYFNSRLSWAPDAWVTQHAYALDARRARRPPRVAAADASNVPLYVGSRAAADFGNAAFRAWWIAKAQAALAAGYRGLFIDDVFMERRTYLSGGTTLRTPKDPRTGATMTEANWQKYMADFMVAVRAALPSRRDRRTTCSGTKGDSGDVLRGLQAANVVSVDGGFTDQRRLRHPAYGSRRSRAGSSASRGAAAAWSSTTPTASAPARLYGLAAYLLVDNGASAIANDASTAPGAFWSGYDVDLGTRRTPRATRSPPASGAVTSRAASCSSTSRTAARGPSRLPAGYQDLDGVAAHVGDARRRPGRGARADPDAGRHPDARAAGRHPDPAAVAPVATSPPRRRSHARRPRRTITTVTTGGDGAAKARASGTAGAADPGGDVRLRAGFLPPAERTRPRRGRRLRPPHGRAQARQQVGRRAAHEGLGQEERQLLAGHPAPARGAYRVSGYFEGTGTSKPSRSSAKPFRA